MAGYNAANGASERDIWGEGGEKERSTCSKLATSNCLMQPVINMAAYQHRPNPYIHCHSNAAIVIEVNKVY